jgi:hypothetical protein
LASVRYVELGYAFMWERSASQDQSGRAKKDAPIQSHFRTPPASPGRFTWRPEPVRLTDDVFPALS